MAATPLSLLERLRTRPDANSWQRLVDLYTPLIADWLRRHALQPADADDLAQEVLQIVVRELPNFRHDLRTGAFRPWLRNITVNRLRTFWRSQHTRELVGTEHVFNVLAQLEDPNSGLSQLWDEEHDRHVLRRLLQLLEPEFDARAWHAFRRLVFDGQP